jgi:putative phosphoribosyl transferase
VAPAEVVRALAAEVDELVCLWQPDPFHAVGAHYRDFRQVDDQAVATALAEAGCGPGPARPGARTAGSA